ncbi:MAG: AraC family transcriptional regulator, partial [Cyanobacteriota bacterium]|nr:AraC family transcriptional regulator [Cyanobacteriota bacterium]
PQLDKIFDFIEANYHQPISLNKVAKTFNYSAAYLTSLVRRLTGKTLYKWIVQRRMFQARYLLISSNSSVREIAESVGYSDPGHFIKQFNQIHHQPPQSWRNSQRQLAS